jgi:hypothetical protein
MKLISWIKNRWIIWAKSKEFNTPKYLSGKKKLK